MQYCYQPPVRFCRMSYDMPMEMFEQPLMAGPKKIMVADSSVSIRQMLAFTLKSAGYDVIEAVDGQEALTKLRSGAGFYLVITDRNLTKMMDGLTLIRQLRGMPAYKTTPILLMSTSISDADKNAAKAAGATGWILKPFDPTKIVEIVRKLIG